MKNRAQRQLEIRRIIQNESVHSQEELLVKLKSKGFDLTQATLSRDLKEMQVAKVPHPLKGYTYNIPNIEPEQRDSEKSRFNYLADGFKGIQFSGNLAVVKTQPGYASSIAAVIDNANSWEILGTIAGDDTILIIMKEGISKLDLINALTDIMPNLKGRI